MPRRMTIWMLEPERRVGEKITMEAQAVKQQCLIRSIVSQQSLIHFCGNIFSQRHRFTDKIWMSDRRINNLWCTMEAVLVHRIHWIHNAKHRVSRDEILEFICPQKCSHNTQTWWTCSQMRIWQLKLKR